MTHIKSVADLRRLLTDESTYIAANEDGTAAQDDGDGDESEVVASADDDDSNVVTVRDDDGETIEIEEEVDDDDDENGDAASEARSRSTEGERKTPNAGKRVVAKKSTTGPSVTTAKRRAASAEGEGER